MQMVSATVSVKVQEEGGPRGRRGQKPESERGRNTDEKELKLEIDSEDGRAGLIDAAKLDEEIASMIEALKCHPSMRPFVVQKDTTSFNYFEFEITSKPRKRRFRSIKAYLEKKRTQKLKEEDPAAEGARADQHRRRGAKSGVGSEVACSSELEPRPSISEPIYQSSGDEAGHEKGKRSATSSGYEVAGEIEIFQESSADAYPAGEQIAQAPQQS